MKLIDSDAAGQAIRIDKLLFYLRFARSRTMAKILAEKGHLRLNGRRVEHGHFLVRANDILTVPVGRKVHVVRVIALPKRRAGAPEAQSCYEILEVGY